MLLRTQSPIKVSNKLCAGREQKAQNLAILYTTEKSSFLFSSLHILSNVFVKRQHWIKATVKRILSKRGLKTNKPGVTMGQVWNLFCLDVIIEANQICSLHVVKSRSIYIQSDACRLIPVWFYSSSLITKKDPKSDDCLSKFDWNDLSPIFLVTILAIVPYCLFSMLP